MFQGNLDAFFEKKMEFGRKVVENCGYLETIAIYRAVRDEDLSLCSSEGSRNFASRILALRYAGENRCAEITDSGFRSLCTAVNSDDCSSLDGWKKVFCEIALKNKTENTAIIADNKEVLQAISLPIPIGKDTALFSLGIYYGFKYYSFMACERFLKDADVSLAWRLSCQLIFADDFEKEKENIVNDLSLFILDREMGDSGLCGQMKNRLIRDYCSDKAVQKLSDIW